MWYVRTRGRVIGPFSESDIRKMRAGRQLQGFDEVSQDQVVWEAVDLHTIFEPVVVSGPGIVEPAISLPVGGGPAVARPPVRKSSTSKITWLIGGGILAASVLVVGVVAFVAKNRGTANGGSTPSTDKVTVATVPSGIVRFDPTTTATDRAKVLDETVGFIVAGKTWTRPGGSQFDLWDSTGTGFVIHTDGYLLTNKHVVVSVANEIRSPFRSDYVKKNSIEIEPKLWVFFGRKNKYEAKIVYLSDDYDVAILKIDRKCTWAFPLTDCVETKIPPLEKVYSIGFPAVDRDAVTEKEQIEQFVRDKDRGSGAIQSKFPESAFTFSQSDGPVTKKAVKRLMGKGQAECYVLQHRATISAGNSGGPLISKSGMVIGINTWSQNQTVKDKAGNDLDRGNPNNINYALTLLQLREEIDKYVPNVAWQPLSE
jgi:S1-C subfamily serine protease